MKFFAYVPVLLLVAQFCAAQQTPAAKLLATVNDFHQALVSQNTVSLNQQTDKALSYGHSNGWVQDKKALIKDLQSGLLVYKRFVTDSVTTSINGNLANVRFVAEIDAVLNGVSNRYRLKVLEVWVLKGKRWLLFARQAVKA